MAELILLKCNIGSKAATVLCPECGRISRQILAAPYSLDRVAELIRPHTCPICENRYRSCNANQADNWLAVFARYNHNEDVYNQSIKEDYARKTASHTIPISQPAIHSTSAVQSEHYWFCGVALNQLSSEYSYISDIGRIDIGTEVVVPFGNNNTHRIGIVKTCRLLSTQETPYLIDKIKHIIRKATEEDLHPETIPKIV